MTDRCFTLIYLSQRLLLTLKARWRASLYWYFMGIKYASTIKRIPIGNEILIPLHLETSCQKSDHGTKGTGWYRINPPILLVYCIPALPLILMYFFLVEHLWLYCVVRLSSTSQFGRTRCAPHLRSLESQCSADKMAIQC